MKTKLFTLLLLTAVSATVHAGLVSRAGGTMIYDDVLDITWLQDANYAQTSGFDADGRMNWFDAVAWADGLSFGGYDDWRIPGFTGETRCAGQNCTDSEYGHMFYNNMDATAFSTILAGSNAANIALFTNIQESFYWSELFSLDLTLAFVFGIHNGLQGAFLLNEEHYAWAVRSGDVAAVPVPASLWLFGSALIGLVGLNKRR